MRLEVKADVATCGLSINGVRLITAVLSVGLIMSGCSRKLVGGKTPNPAIFRYPIIEEPPNFDPSRVQDVYITELLGNIFEGLITTDASNKIAPSLAQRWDVSPDGKTYTFQWQNLTVPHD